MVLFMIFVHAHYLKVCCFENVIIIPRTRNDLLASVCDAVSSADDFRERVNTVIIRSTL